jgi:Calcium-dependent channel, 7TM region, putative phosphate
VVTLVMTYACIAPVILVPGLLFFACAQVTYRHQLLYVYEPEFESGGAFFPKVSVTVTRLLVHCDAPVVTP